MRIFLFISGFTLGISIFLLGLRLLGDALTSVLGFRLRSLLTRLTATKGKSLFAGFLITGLIQSSSAVCSTMVVMVDAGILSLRQALGVMLGANIGTTITGQIMAFSLDKVAFPFILAGLVMVFYRKQRGIGSALVSLGAIFYGLSLTTTMLTPLLRQPILQQILVRATDTSLRACFVGVVVTMLVQSSSAVTGLVIGLTRLGLLPLPAAVAIALGSNVGTVLTTLIASIGRNRASRATAYADFLFNVGGVILVLPVFPLFLRLIHGFSASPARQVANAHTIFNVVTALIVLPFLDYLARLAWWGAGIRRGNKNIKD